MLKCRKSHDFMPLFCKEFPGQHARSAPPPIPSAAAPGSPASGTPHPHTHTLRRQHTGLFIKSTNSILLFIPVLFYMPEHFKWKDSGNFNHFRFRGVLSWMINKGLIKFLGLRVLHPNRSNWHSDEAKNSPIWAAPVATRYKMLLPRPKEPLAAPFIEEGTRIWRSSFVHKRSFNWLHQ